MMHEDSLGADDGLDQEWEGSAKRPRLSSPQDHEICLKLLVSPNAAGKIIGRGGADIKALRDELSIVVRIVGLENAFPKAPDHQIAVILGGVDNINVALETVIAKIVEAEPSADATLRLTALMTQNAVSCTIGTKGATISEIKKESGCSISADPGTYQGEQLVTVTGGYENVHAALCLLTPIIANSADSVQFADARYTMGSAKGDWGKGDWGKGKELGYGKGKDMSYVKGKDMSYGKGKDMSYGKGKDMGYGKDTGFSVGMSKGKGKAQPATHALSAAEEERMVMESDACIQFSIPKDSIGRVLGKAGASSKEISTLTGAQLKIEPREEDGLVVLSGQLHSVHKAHCMVVGRVLSSY
jgi:transcription antitermination factor NusA-like protein